MFDRKRSDFLERMAFGERQASAEPSPRLSDLLIDAAWMLGVTAYMAAVLVLLYWAFGR